MAETNLLNGLFVFFSMSLCLFLMLSIARFIGMLVNSDTVNSDLMKLKYLFQKFFCQRVIYIIRSYY